MRSAAMPFDIKVLADRFWPALRESAMFLMLVAYAVGVAVQLDLHFGVVSSFWMIGSGT